MTHQAKTLESEDVDILLGYIEQTRHKKRDRAMFMLTWLAGLRVSEVAQLKLSDVRAENALIKNEIRLNAYQTKGGKRRIVFLSDRLKEELVKYLQDHTDRSDEESLFLTQKSGARGFTPNTLAQHFYWLYKKAGISGASSHSGRRTFATTLSAKGVPPRVIMRAMGHQDISSTMIYVDASDDMVRSAVNVI